MSLWRELGTNDQGVNCDLSMTDPPQAIEDLGPNGCNCFEKLKLPEVRPWFRKYATGTCTRILHPLALPIGLFPGHHEPPPCAPLAQSNRLSWPQPLWLCFQTNPSPSQLLPPGVCHFWMTSLSDTLSLKTHANTSTVGSHLSLLEEGNLGSRRGLSADT